MNHSHHIKQFRNRFIVSSLLTIPLLALSPTIQSLLGFQLAIPHQLYILFGLSTLIFIYGGWPFVSGFFSELTNRRPGMMTLITLAICVAYTYSTAVIFGFAGKMFFWELATLIDIMLLGHWIEMRSVHRASSALEKLVALLPGFAHKVGEDGTITSVPCDQLQPDDNIQIKPGEKIPADGIVTAGNSRVNQAAITGESLPISKKAGDDVIAGTLNADGALTVRVTQSGKQSYVAIMTEMVRKAQQSKSLLQDTADKAAFWLTLIAIITGGATFAFWYALPAPLSFAMERMVTVMVITCPHALGLAIPLVVVGASTWAARNGLLIRNRNAFENSRKLTTIVFDKTGTLTKGSFKVTDIVANNEWSEHNILKCAASIEQKSEHPIATAIVDAALVRNIKPLRVANFKAISGAGVQAFVNGHEVMLANPEHLRDQLPTPTHVDIHRLSSQGKTVIVLLAEKQVQGLIALGDAVRDESRAAVQELTKLGITSVMMTGDNEQAAQAIAHDIGVKEFFANVLPDQKATKIKELQAQGQVVAMVGDGINDALALTQADVGVAIGAGTDVAIESGDVVLVHSDPRALPTLVTLSVATHRKMVQNVVWATGYNIVALPLAAGVLYPFGIMLSPAVGALVMSLSTIIVALNSRLMRLPKRKN